MRYETTFYLTCPMCSSEICTGDTDEFLIVECMEVGCLYRCTRKAWPKDLVKGVSRGAPTLPSMVFTIHHKGVEYVKLEDYMALAKSVAVNTEVPFPFKTRTALDWGIEYCQNPDFDNIQDLVRGIRREAATMLREMLGRPSSHSMGDAALRQAADELERLP